VIIVIEIKDKDIKKRRIIKFFINAASQIIEKEGIEKVTIRKVAKIAGYNSATIYNYFDNNKQLIFFAATKFIKDYVQTMPSYISQGHNTLEKFLLMWEIFSIHSFQKPNIFYAIFTENVGDKPENLVGNYYQLFPEDLGNPPKELTPMLLESNLSKRAAIAIQPCINEGYFTTQAAQELDEAIMLIYHGMLTLLVNNRVNYMPREAANKIMKHIRYLTYNLMNKD
jgi:AcrR family transcriptional regulator